MWPAAYSERVADVEHDELLVVVEPGGELVWVDLLEPADPPALRAPGGHPADEESAHRQPDRGEQVGGRELIAVGGGDDDQLDVGRHDLGDLGREARVIGRGADRPGDVGLVELVVGARVDEQRAAGDRDLDRARAQRRRRPELLDQRAAVELDDVLDVRRPVAEGGDRVGGELVGGRRSETAWLWASSKPIVDEVRWSIPELPQSEPPR